ncbi:DNA glycosylase [Thozetella sp. PMI_491]|nr:DNA glycosylase [Thozetella sp. PMI_491]
MPETGATDNAEERPPPSFEGRLKLQDFMFQAAESESPARRRSPRLSVPAGGASPSPVRPASANPKPPSRGASPLKRKSAARDVVRSSSSTPASPPAKKRRPKPSGYAPPSTYAHLPLLPDAVAPNLLVFLVGLNPGIETARSGHSYAHPTNLFWRLLHSSGMTPHFVPAVEDRTLPKRFSLGLTNIVSRPSRNGAELSKAEMDEGVGILEEKARRWRPEVMCIVGKSIWESIWRVRHGRGIRAAEFKYGWQDAAENMGVVGLEGHRDEEREEEVDYGDGGPWAGARVFVATSTSGLAATLKPAEKEKIWRELGEWVETRRKEREAAAKYKTDP